MPSPYISVISENCKLEIISKKHDLSRKRITIFHGTNPPQVFRVARKLGIECINLSYMLLRIPWRWWQQALPKSRNKLPIKTASQPLGVKSSTFTSRFALEKNYHHRWPYSGNDLCSGYTLNDNGDNVRSRAVMVAFVVELKLPRRMWCHVQTWPMIRTLSVTRMWSLWCRNSRKDKMQKQRLVILS